MRSPTLALLWEIWRTKRGLIAAAVAMSLVGLYGRLTEEVEGNVILATGSNDPDPALFFTLRIVSLLLLFGIVNYTESGDGRGFGGFPDRLFALPVSTLRLVALPMLAGIVGIELHFLAWMDRTPGMMNASPVYYGVVMAVSIVLYQVTLWTLERLRSMKLVVLGVLGFVMVVAAQAPMFSFFENAPLDPERFLMLLMSGIGIGAFLLGWRYVGRLRHGDGNASSLLSLSGLMDTLPGRSRGFHTPAGAQTWYEWRTIGVMYPLIVLGMLVLVIAPLLLLLGDDPARVQNIVIWTLAMPVMFAQPFGIVISKPSLWDEGLYLPVITATKPLSAAELVAIRIRAVTLSVVVAWGLVLAFLAVLPLWANVDALAGFAAEWRTFHDGSAASVWMAAALVLLAGVWLSWRFMVSSLWIGLSGSKPWFNTLISLLAVVPIFAFVFDVGRLPGWLLAEPARLTGLVWLTGLAVAAKYGLAAVSWRRVPVRIVVQYLLIAAAGTASFILLWLAFRDVLGTFIPAFGMGQVQTAVVLAALLLVPLARPGFAPAALARNRHRRV